MTEPVWWCPECGRNDSELADRPWHLAKPPSPDFPVKWEKCPGTPIDLIEEREHIAETEALNQSMADTLSRIAIALKGPEPELTSWGWSDLPELAEKLVEEREQWIQAVGLASTCVPDMEIDTSDPIGMMHRVVAERERLLERELRLEETIDEWKRSEPLRRSAQLCHCCQPPHPYHWNQERTSG